VTSLVLSFHALRKFMSLPSRWAQTACIATLSILLPLVLVAGKARADVDGGTANAPDAGAAPSSPSGVTGSVDAGDAATPTSSASEAENPAPPPSAAEAPPNETPDGGPAVDTETALKSVVVTAEKREENIQQVPLSITAASGERVRSLGVEASSDVPRLVPNMSAATTEGRSRPRWFIRGVGNNDTSSNAVSPVGVYFDEVYENFVLGQAFPLFDLERVEILRGPQGTLWGKNTTGGAISFISRKPSFDPDAYAEATVGNHAEFGVQGAGGGAIVKDKVAARASFFYESRNGWVTNVVNNQTQGDIRDAAGRVQLLITPIDALEATLSVHFRHNDGQSQAFYLVQSNGSVGPIPGFNGYKEGSRWYTAENNGPDIDVDDQKGGLANVKLFSGPVILTSITAYENTSRTLAGDADYSPLEATGVTRSFAHAEQISEEVRAAPTKPDRFTWVVGAHYFHERLFSDAASGSLPAIPTLPAYKTFYSDTTFIQHTESFAGFANGAYDFTKWFRLQAGARWTVDTKDIDLAAVNTGARGNAVWGNVGDWWLRQSVASPLTGAASQNTSRTWNAPTVDISPSFNISPDATAYFHYGHGFRGGTFNGGVSVQSNVSVVNPETVDAYEIGAKTKWFGDRLSASASLFHYDYHDIQVLVNAVTASTTATATVLQNAGKATINGAELEAEALPVPPLHLRGSLGLLDATYGGFQAVNNNQVVNASGNKLVRAPPVTLLLDGEYAIPVGASSIAIGTDWEYTAHQFYNAVDQQNPNLQQNGYILGNARVSVFSPGKTLEVQAWVHNLADTQYKILGVQGAPGYNGIIFGPPRLYGLSVIAVLK
jgi:iron complex outermembrane receptor protein